MIRLNIHSLLKEAGRDPVLVLATERGTSGISIPLNKYEYKLIQEQMDYPRSLHPECQKFLRSRFSNDPRKIVRVLIANFENERPVTELYVQYRKDRVVPTIADFAIAIALAIHFELPIFLSKRLLHKISPLRRISGKSGGHGTILPPITEKDAAEFSQEELEGLTPDRFKEPK